MSADTYTSARASWQAVKDAQKAAAAAQQADCLAALPPDLLTEAQAMRSALSVYGIASTIIPSTPAQPTRPARVIVAEEVAGLDARDPRRTLYQYQRAFALRGKPVPQHITAALRAAARDEMARQKRRQRAFGPNP
jgi:hypothetical protein